MLKSEIKIIADGGRRRCWSAAEKLRIVEETLFDGESLSAVARRNGAAPNLLNRWRKLLLEGGSVAVTGGDGVTRNKQVRLWCQPRGTFTPNGRRLNMYQQSRRATQLGRPGPCPEERSLNCCGDRPVCDRKNRAKWD